MQRVSDANGREISMRFTAMLGVLVLGFGAGTAPAAYQVTFSTGQTGAQTQIDLDHTTAYNFSVFADAPTITSIIGDFKLKRGPKTSEDIVFTLWDQFDGYLTPGAGVLASTSRGPLDIDGGDFTSTLFTLSDLMVGPGNYSVSLTSGAPDSQAQAYFIKGSGLQATPPQFIDTNPSPPPAPAVVAEPASIAMVALGTGLVGMYGLRRRRHFQRPRVA
jgi:hypothetical protein